MEKEIHVSISQKNIKMGYIASVSLPPLKTCSAEACKTCAKEKCYAVKICRLRPSVNAAYNRNLTILQEDPSKYWREVEAAIMGARVFRFHVGGDIVDYDYLNHMVEIAKRNEHCQILAFTKKFSICNDYLAVHKRFPKNLHIIFSAWRGLTMENPYSLPECHVLFKDGTTTQSEKKKSFYCPGNCYECFLSCQNCFALKKNEQVLIREH